MAVPDQCLEIIMCAHITIKRELELKKTAPLPSLCFFNVSKVHEIRYSGTDDEVRI